MISCCSDSALACMSSCVPLEAATCRELMFVRPKCRDAFLRQVAAIRCWCKLRSLHSILCVCVRVCVYIVLRLGLRVVVLICCVFTQVVPMPCDMFWFRLRFCGFDCSRPSQLLLCTANFCACHRLCLVSLCLMLVCSCVWSCLSCSLHVKHCGCVQTSSARHRRCLLNSTAL